MDSESEQSEQIQFRGQDVTECRQFIAAILKHAFSQGKQRDDQWMADFAATCLADDALSWWSALDEEVQGSWKLLRRAMLSKYRPMFYGESGEEAEKFIRVVCDKAIDEGKKEDNKWIVTYASACFAREALRWYVCLDPDTQDNWKKLQQAILLQYPRNPPAGAALNTVPMVPMTAATSVPRTTRRGRIRVSKANFSTPYYLSKYLTESRITPTSSLAHALEVEWDPSSEFPQTLSIPDLQITGHDLLGLKWYTTTADLSDDFLGLCAVNSQTNSTSLTSFNGNLFTKAWKLSLRGTDGGEAWTLSAMVGGVTLFARWTFEPRNKWNHVWYAAQSVHPSYSAELIFEPVQYSPSNENVC